MEITKLDEKTLNMITKVGDRIAADVIKLENLIWLVKAEAYTQLGELTKRYVDQNSNGNHLTTEKDVAEIEAACTRALQLSKLWSQEVAMRNRAVHFGQMRERQLAAWQALEE